MARESQAARGAGEWAARALAAIKDAEADSSLSGAVAPSARGAVREAAALLAGYLDATAVELALTLAFQAGAIVGRSAGERDGIAGGVSFSERLQSLRQAHNGAQGAGKARMTEWKAEAWHIYTGNTWGSVRAASVPIAEELQRRNGGKRVAGARTVEGWLNDWRRAVAKKPE